jgi:hypothetical protein
MMLRSEAGDQRSASVTHGSADRLRYFGKKVSWETAGPKNSSRDDLQQSECYRQRQSGDRIQV